MSNLLHEKWIIINGVVRKRRQYCFKKFDKHFFLSKNFWSRIGEKFQICYTKNGCNKWRGAKKKDIKNLAKILHF